MLLFSFLPAGNRRAHHFTCSQTAATSRATCVIRRYSWATAFQQHFPRQVEKPVCRVAVPHRLCPLRRLCSFAALFTVKLGMISVIVRYFPHNKKPPTCRKPLESGARKLGTCYFHGIISKSARRAVITAWFLSLPPEITAGVESGHAEDTCHRFTCSSPLLQYYVAALALGESRPRPGRPSAPDRTGLRKSIRETGLSACMTFAFEVIFG